MSSTHQQRDMETAPDVIGEQHVEEENEDDEDIVDSEDMDEDRGMNDQEAMDEFMETFFHDEVEDDLHALPPRQRATRKRAWTAAEEHAKERIYEGARVSRLSAILMLLNLQARYQASNALLNDLLRTLNQFILPAENSLPSSWKEAKKLLRSIGMEYHIIHACENDCVLFRNEHANLDECPECGLSRYRSDMVTDKVPRKAMRYFPLIPRLLHNFRCSDLAEYMVWHSEHRSDDGIMRSPVDSHANDFIERRWPDFQNDPRHVRLGVAADGIVPHSMTGKSQPYSLWPVILMNYNIPPWLSMKKGHLMLSMLIPGPKQPMNMDVYLAPLIEELQELWEGVPAYDGRRLTGGLPRNFDLKAILMWTMHDYPGI